MVEVAERHVVAAVERGEQEAGGEPTLARRRIGRRTNNVATIALLDPITKIEPGDGASAASLRR